jgi:hypothetical protein
MIKGLEIASISQANQRQKMLDKKTWEICLDTMLGIWLKSYRNLKQKQRSQNLSHFENESSF